MSKELRSRVLEVLTEAGRSINEISKDVGFAKSNPKVKACLEAFVEEGAVRTELHARGWKLYTANKASIAKAQKMSQISSDITSFLEGKGSISATAIAKGCGLNKGNQIQSTLDELVSSGGIESDTGGRFTLYSISGLETEITRIRRRLPVDNHGYKFSENKKGGWTITTPSGRIEQCGERETLVVINDDPYAFVEFKDEVLKAAVDYAEEQGIRTYTLKDATTGKNINKSEDIDSEPIVIFMTLTRHNKAGS